jgi:hypothetical protein
MGWDVNQLVLIDRLRGHPWKGGMLVLSIIAIYPAFYSVINFATAVTPAQAAAQGLQMPPWWSAGVYQHGHVYEWYTIGKKPLLFSLSVAGLVLSLGYIYYLIFSAVWQRRQQRRRAGPA